MLQLICVDNALVICGFDGQILHMSSNPQTGETCKRKMLDRKLQVTRRWRYASVYGVCAC